MLIRTEGGFFGDEPWRFFWNIYHMYYVSCRPMSQSSSCASRQKPPSVCTHSAGASTPQRQEGWSRLAARSASRLSPMTWTLRGRRLVRSRRIPARAPRLGSAARALPPVHRAGQPLAAIAASLYALRPCACGSLVAASRYALGADGRCAPGRLHLLLPR